MRPSTAVYVDNVSKSEKVFEGSRLEALKFVNKNEELKGDGTFKLVDIQYCDQCGERARMLIAHDCPECHEDQELCWECAKMNQPCGVCALERIGEE